MEKEFLKINGFYEVTYPSRRVIYVKVLNIFPNNFLEVWYREGYVDYATLTKSSFNMGLATRMFINLDQVESLREMNLRD